MYSNLHIVRVPRGCNITASTPNAIVNYLRWAQFSLQSWHFWWVSFLFQWLPTMSKPALRSYFTHHTRKYFGCERRRGLHGGRHLGWLVHVFLMFWGLLAQPAGRSDWPVENYPVRTHIATPENLMPFCYISPDWTNPCFLPIAECNTSCDWMALVVFMCMRHLAGISVSRSWALRETGRDLCRQVWLFFFFLFFFSFSRLFGVSGDLIAFFWFSGFWDIETVMEFFVN